MSDRLRRRQAPEGGESRGRVCCRTKRATATWHRNAARKIDVRQPGREAGRGCGYRPRHGSASCRVRARKGAGRELSCYRSAVVGITGLMSGGCLLFLRSTRPVPLSVYFGITPATTRPAPLPGSNALAQVARPPLSGGPAELGSVQTDSSSVNRSSVHACLRVCTPRWASSTEEPDASTAHVRIGRISWTGNFPPVTFPPRFRRFRTLNLSKASRQDNRMGYWFGPTTKARASVRRHWPTDPAQCRADPGYPKKAAAPFGAAIFTTVPRARRGGVSRDSAHSAAASPNPIPADLRRTVRGMPVPEHR